MLTEGAAFKVSGGFVLTMVGLAIVSWLFAKFKASKEEDDTDAPRVAPIPNGFGGNYDNYFWDDEGGEVPFLANESSLEVRSSRRCSITKLHLATIYSLALMAICHG